MDVLWLVPALPLAGFLVLVLGAPVLGRKATTSIGVGSVGLSACVAIYIAVVFATSASPGGAYVQTLWTWIDVAKLDVPVAFYLDALAVVMMLVVTVVGFLIHLYSAGFLVEDDGYRRFFAYMNLFVAAMLVLVLAQNFVFLFLGWEGVGLCSYLLIGFWYEDPENGRAARKAFIVTRVGDVALLVGLFLLYESLGSLDIQELMFRASELWESGSPVAIATALLLLGGAVGKSAQLPLQVWLPDAMAGPSPVSALIHAATMVTAGVYLIARTHMLFEIAAPVQAIVAVIGALTLLLAAFSALGQHDIKRILAYSTISQIGYMFLALGIGAYRAAIFHFMTHAFFKALLFLSAGVVITSMRDEHNIFRMGALRQRLPEAFWPFLIGSASLAALPLVTAGFFSKDLILWRAWTSDTGSGLLWLAGATGALLTSIYIFRAVFIAFLGPPRRAVSHRCGMTMILPLVILSLLSLAGGWIELPRTIGSASFFSDFLAGVLPAANAGESSLVTEAVLQAITAVLSLGGLCVAYLLFVMRPRWLAYYLDVPIARRLKREFARGFGFDRLYDAVFIKPFLIAAKYGASDPIDRAYDGLVSLARLAHRVLSASQTGRLRDYASVLTIGVIAMLALMVMG